VDHASPAAEASKGSGKAKSQNASRKREAEDESSGAPIKKAKHHNGETAQSAVAESAQLDPDMDPETAALIQSMLKTDAPMLETVKMGRRKDTSIEGKSFAFFGEEGRQRKAKSKKVESNSEAEQATDGTIADAEPGLTETERQSPPPASSTPKPQKMAREPIVYVPSDSKATGTVQRKRKRWDMAPEKFVETQLEGLLRTFHGDDDREAAAKTASMLAEYANENLLFHLGACLLRVEAIICRDGAKLENAVEFGLFAERKAQMGADWVLAPGKEVPNVDADTKDIRNFVQGLISWLQQQASK
jgi:hypothetical protein